MTTGDGGERPPVLETYLGMQAVDVASLGLHRVLPVYFRTAPEDKEKVRLYALASPHQNKIIRCGIADRLIKRDLRPVGNPKII